MLSKQETLVAARETLDELSLENRLSIDEMGWPGAAGVLWVRFNDLDAAPLTVFVPWELADETADGFKEKLKREIIRLNDPPDKPFSVT